MQAMEAFAAQYQQPADTYAPVPFWFLNDAPEAKEMRCQLEAFYAQGIRCVVLHPRIGIPPEMPYLSDAFMERMRQAVEAAAALGMRVILYDEGMYPSGSACGQVVAENPAYAARCITPLYDDTPLPADAQVLSDRVYPVCEDGSVALDRAVGYEGAIPACARRIRIVHRPSGGTMRGIHFGQDDGEPGAPPAADILNPAAVDCFIRLTHARYHACVGAYFGGVVWGFFTDEPSPMGRGPLAGAHPWTEGFETELAAAGIAAGDLAALWLEAGPRTASLRARYARCVSDRLGQVFYGRLAAWCRAHGLALMGHPAESDETLSLRYFDIPGQDLVFRYAAPEKDNLHSRHGVMAKLAADIARLDEKPRNLNEALGCCYREGTPWDLPFADAKWMLDFLLARGCNLLVLHAFYYSLRGARKDERPPDVGMYSPWWGDFARISRYIARLCRLNTGLLDAPIAVICRDQEVPTGLVAPLYARQIGFVYVEEARLAHIHAVGQDGAFSIGPQRFMHLLQDASVALSSGTAEMLAEKGIAVLGLDELSCGAWADAHLSLSLLAEPQAGVRCQRMTLDGVSYVTAFNEGADAASITLRAPGFGQVWLPFEEGRYAMEGAFCLQAGETAVFVQAEPVDGLPVRRGTDAYKGIALSRWTLNGEPTTQRQAQAHRMTEPQDTQAVYGMSFALQAGAMHSVRVRLESAYACAYLRVNGMDAGACLASPGSVDITPHVHSGENRLEIRVVASPANRLDAARIPCGLLGGVQVLALPGGLPR